MGMIITLAALFLPGPSDISFLSAARGGVPPSVGLPHWHLVRGGSPITEPYPALHGGSFSGPQVRLSPDPLVAYRWPHSGAGNGLQTYVLRPVAVQTQTPTCFSSHKIECMDV